ncbi:MAG: class I adenylate-forming enzyme family protein [Betaproteobacteria bacterium]
MTFSHGIATKSLPTATDPGVAQIQRLREVLEDARDVPATLGELVHERAKMMGEALAGHWFEDGVRLTYRELDMFADRLASSLLAHGVRKGTHVAVMLPNVAAFPITWIALARLGAVMVPVNASYTSTELRFVLQDSDSQFLVIDAQLLPVLRDVSPRPPLLADERTIVHGLSTPSSHLEWQRLVDEGQMPFTAPSKVMATDLVNLQYTSGTTGFPKGCLLTNDYWMLISRLASLMRGAGGDVKNVLVWAPFYYMDAQWQFLMTLWLSGTAFVARHMSLARFHEWLIEYRIHMCIYPEAALKQTATPESDAQLWLKYLSIYGWGADARREVECRFNIRAREGYGMTEIGAATHVPSDATHMAHTRSCGLAVPFRELRIVDAAGRDVPDGEEGELWVAGRAIFWGYYKQPEANAERFRGRWFRTGDIFRRDANGYYWIVGRIKDMIKRAGENIAAIEVEAVLRALPEIEEAAVVAVPDPLRREEVKAYLKLRPGLTPEDVPPARVFAHCVTQLAAFKVPRYLAYVAGDFPRTPTRKIIKRMLVEESTDLREGAFDRVDDVWR